MSDEYIWPPPLSEYEQSQIDIQNLQTKYDLMDTFLAEMIVQLKEKTAQTSKWQQTAEMLYFSCKRAQESGDVLPLAPAVKFYEKARAIEDSSDRL
jgi:hypothetical protein